MNELPILNHDHQVFYINDYDICRMCAAIRSIESFAPKEAKV